MKGKVLVFFFAITSLFFEPFLIHAQPKLCYLTVSKKSNKIFEKGIEREMLYQISDSFLVLYLGSSLKKPVEKAVFDTIQFDNIQWIEVRDAGLVRSYKRTVAYFAATGAVVTMGAAIWAASDGGELVWFWVVPIIIAPLYAGAASLVGMVVGSIAFHQEPVESIIDSDYYNFQQFREQNSNCICEYLH